MSTDFWITSTIVGILFLILVTMFACQANDNATAVKLKEAGMEDMYIDCVLSSNVYCKQKDD